MNQYNYIYMDGIGRAMYEAQQAAVARSNESLCKTLFGCIEPSWTWEEIAESTIKNRRSYAINRIKAQPFFMPNA